MIEAQSASDRLENFYMQFVEEKTEDVSPETLFEQYRDLKQVLEYGDRECRRRIDGSEEIEHKDVPLFVDIITRDESGEGWETERRPLNIGNSE